jgi:hypothetical protein
VGRERVLAALAVLATLAVLVSVVATDAEPLSRQPVPDSQEYADAARQIAQGDGNVVTLYGPDEQPPRYPPGYAMALAIGTVAGEWPQSVQRAARGYVLLYVLVLVGAAWLLGGPLAAVVAALVVGVSPFARELGQVVLADPLGATLAVAVLPLLRPVTRTGARLAGALGGFGVLVRLAGITTLAATLVALPREQWLRTAAWAAPGVLGLLALQWLTFGGPFDNGYAYWLASEGNFALSNATNPDPPSSGRVRELDVLGGALVSDTVNLVFYPAVVLGLAWIVAPPLFTALGLVWAWRHRRDPVGRYALAVTVLGVGLMVVYLFQSPRLVAAPASVLTVLAAVQVAELWRGLRPEQLAEVEREPGQQR